LDREQLIELIERLAAHDATVIDQVEHALDDITA
jgi:hypothetical protein